MTLNFSMRIFHEDVRMPSSGCLVRVPTRGRIRLKRRQLI
jgi:hypothetical protein